MPPLLICNCLDLEIEHLFKNNYSYFHLYCTSLTDQEILMYDNIVIVGEFYNLPEQYFGKVSWVITDNTFSYDLLNKGNYDTIDNFFIYFIDTSINSALVSRYTKKYVNMYPDNELYIGHRITPPRKNLQKDKEIKFLSVLDDIQKITDFRDNTVKKKVILGGALNIRSNFNPEILDKQIMYSLTGDPSFFYKNTQSISNSISFRQEIENIYTEYRLKYNCKNSNEKLEIINTNYTDKHQLDLIKTIYSLELQLKEPIILDTDIFKTFYTDHYIYKKNKKIPYTQNWVGILTNPFSSETDFSLDILLNNEDFKESLLNCKGVIVFTKYLAKKLNNLGVRIFNINYPIKNPDSKFNFQKWLNSPRQLLLQYPSECIDTFGIYRLELNKNCCIQKVTCIDYFENYTSNINTFFEKRISSFLHDKKKQIEIINYVYTDCIVFMYIIDCSVIPFLLECIVRNIPVVVNSHEAVVEYFGTSYPLFYNSYTEAVKIIEDSVILQKGYTYLSNLNKDNYSLDKFNLKIKEILLNCHSS